ncbi:MAG: transcription antitermination factor NusB [Parcubacteria group bacterium]|nr:transcription antitermination factor NusB [Parcubacteria group bacterium]
MANRHLSRSIALQSLFEWDFYDRADRPIRAIVERNLREFAPGLEDNAFVFGLANGVIAHQKQIDTIIEKAAPEWPLKQIALTDRNVLRIGLYELLFANRDEVPPKVAINEAIELAKTFGSDTSGKFVNGVLGTIYREIGEPGKDDGSKKRRMPLDLDLESLPREELGGAVVWRRLADGYAFALVHDAFGYWTLSKGHLHEGEDLGKGTLRKIAEELGLEQMTIGEALGENEYIASDPKRGPIRRHVTYFLVETPEETLRLAEKGGLDEAGWFRRKALADLRIYDDIRPLLEKAAGIITEQLASN